jgi:nitric oxide reductase activation protein
MDELTKVDNNTDTFFINFSDGYPGFSNSDIDYGGLPAVEHTAKQVKKIVKSGVKVLSYFLHGEYSRGGGENFKRMYGKSAKDVDVTNLLQLTKTLNKLFE